MRGAAVRFDLLRVDRLLDSRHLVVQNPRCVHHTASTGLEVDLVRFVKLQQSHKQSIVGFREVRRLPGNVAFARVHQRGQRKL